MSKSVFSCPVCGRELYCDSKAYRCERNHCFDIAKSGYVNLLTSDKMHSRLPGDNKLMVRARHDFLNRGYYSKLAESLCSTVKDFAPESPMIVDAGCGEGYYTKKLSEFFEAENEQAVIGGIDISKNAADLAAKGCKGIEYAAASVFHLPFADSSADVVLSVFSPLCLDEFSRVLKTGGLFFMVIPDKRHLWELKSVIYDEPYENQVKDYEINGFKLVEACDVPAEKIFLRTNEDIQNLFTMTPYYYNTRPEDKAKLEDLESLETTIEFKILVYKNKGETNGT